MLMDRFRVAQDLTYFSSFKKIPKIQVAQAVQLQIFARDFDPEFGRDGEESSIAQFSNTFSLSTFTSFVELRRSACAYWGVDIREFELFYADSGNNLTNLTAESVKVLSFLETAAFLSVDPANEHKTNKSKSRKTGKNSVPVLYAKLFLGRNKKKHRR